MVCVTLTRNRRAYMICTMFHITLVIEFPGYHASILVAGCVPAINTHPGRHKWFTPSPPTSSSVLKGERFRDSWDAQSIPVPKNQKWLYRLTNASVPKPFPSVFTNAIPYIHVQQRPQNHAPMPSLQSSIQKDWLQRLHNQNPIPPSPPTSPTQ